MRIFFVRHGESEANLLRVFSNRGWKHPLTPDGRRQVDRLAELLQDRGVVAIYSSPLCRAAESAQILGERLAMTFEIEPALVEYDVGIYEDRSDVEGWQACAAVERQWAHGERDAHLPGVESPNDIRARFRPFLERVIARLSGHDRTAAVSSVMAGRFAKRSPTCSTTSLRRSPSRTAWATRRASKPSCAARTCIV